MKLPFKINWLQVATILMCWGMAIMGEATVPIIVMLALVIGELATIRQALEKQNNEPQGKEK